MINDKTQIDIILSSPFIDYLPKITVVETKEFMDQYLKSVSTVQFFNLIIEREELLLSKTINSIIMEVSET